MIPVERFSDLLRELRIDFFTGVPCSYMKAFVSHTAQCDDLPYLAAASEGEAVGIAAGAYLAGRMPMVLIQNSGLGNCVNPLTSLMLPYRIPVLLAVSHRGEGGRDAPQHAVMGEITYALLETMGIPVETLPRDLAGAREVLGRLRRRAQDEMRPVAIVVRKDTFEPYPATAAFEPRRAAAPIGASAIPDPATFSSRSKALSAILDAVRPEDLIVSTTGMTSRELQASGDRPGNFYMAGSMGCAPAIALGASCNLPSRRVIAIDGDGALLMKLGTAATIGHYRPPGLLHIVLDNGCYETTGGQPTTASTVAFDQLAAAAGYPRSAACADVEELRAAVSEFRLGDGPAFLYLPILSGHLDEVPRVELSFPELRDRFRGFALADV